MLLFSLLYRQMCIFNFICIKCDGALKILKTRCWVVAYQHVSLFLMLYLELGLYFPLVFHVSWMKIRIPGVVVFLLIEVDAEEIKRLGKRFKKLDLDNSGSLSIDEFMSLPELQQNPLVQRVIEIFDTDGNGEVDFKGQNLSFYIIIVITIVVQLHGCCTLR